MSITSTNNDFIILKGKKFTKSTTASKISGYTSDYIGQLCRATKIECVRIGKIWYVYEDQLLKYKDKQENPNINKIELAKQIISPVDETENDSRSVKIYKGLGYEEKDNDSLSPTVVTLEKLSNKILFTVIATTFIFCLYILFQSFYVNKIYSGSLKSTATLDTKNQTASVIDANAEEKMGAVVVPKSGDQEKDKDTLDSVKSSFSDQIEITPGNTPNSGIIKPVFKNSKGDDYMYMVVPVKTGS